MTVEIEKGNIDKLLNGITIPPRPIVLVELMKERNKEEPNLPTMARLIASDVGLSAAMMKTVNSPFFGLRKKIESVPQAVTVMGVKNTVNIVTGLMLRTAIGNKNVNFEHFWESADQVAMLCTFLAKRLPGVSSDEAHTYGLFHDCGIPILMQKFPDYKDTLFSANAGGDELFTALEDERHATNHAIIGYLMAKAWCLPETLYEAILRHHDFTVYTIPDSIQPRIRTLIALRRLAEHLRETLLRMYGDQGWEKVRDHVLGALGITEAEYDDIKDEVRRMD